MVIETGEYSDYAFSGPFRVVADFDQAEVIAAFKEEWAPGPNSYKEPGDDPDPSDFVPWMTKRGLIEDVANVVSWHIGSYGHFEAKPQ